MLTRTESRRLPIVPVVGVSIVTVGLATALPPLEPEVRPPPTAPTGDESGAEAQLRTTAMPATSASRRTNAAFIECSVATYGDFSSGAPASVMYGVIRMRRSRLVS